MAPIRKGDGTPLEIPGVQEVRSGDGRVFFEGGAIPDSVVSRPPDDDTISGENSDGLVVSFKENFSRFAFRISNNSTDFTRVRVYDYSQSNYTFSKDISEKNSGDTVVVDKSVSSSVKYGVELDSDGNESTLGFNLTDANDYPYEGEQIDIIAASRNGDQDADGFVRSINDIGNPDNILD